MSTLLRCDFRSMARFAPSLGSPSRVLCYGIGRGTGVGRDLGWGTGLVVGVGVAVGVDEAVAVAVGVGDGHGFFTQPKISTVSTRQPSLDPVVSLAILQRSLLPKGRKPGRSTTVVMKPSELPLQARRPAIGLPRSALILRLYPPVTKVPPATRISRNVFPPSVLVSNTPPSKPRLGSSPDASRLKLCRKVNDKVAGGRKDAYRVEQLVTYHGWVIDKCSVGRCIRRRHWHSGIRCNPQRRRPLGIRCYPVRGNPGGVTLSKCSVNDTGWKQGKGEHEGVGDGVGNGGRDVHSAPTNNIVWRTRRATLLVREKESGFIQDSSTFRNIVTQLRPGRPQQCNCASDVWRRHRCAAKICIIIVGAVVARANVRSRRANIRFYSIAPIYDHRATAAKGSDVIRACNQRTDRIGRRIDRRRIFHGRTIRT